MQIGVPRETHHHEHRVGLTPFGVARLVRSGNEVYVERGCGQDAHFSDRDYADAGARIAYDPYEVYRRTEMICRLGMLSPEEIAFLREGSIICSFHHLAVAPRETVDRLMSLGVTLIGYEVVRNRESGDLAILLTLSELAGQMAVDTAARFLRHESGGRGILLGNAPGLPPATVVILGAGTVGRASARLAAAHGAHVIVIDSDIRKLRAINRELGPQVVTAVAGVARLEKYTSIADVLIGAVLIPGGRSPMLVTESMVRGMKPGSVIIDVSIDQGGCIETSRPTTLDNPTFLAHDVVHYCVPNMTADIPRTASRAMVDGALPYLMEIARVGIREALRSDPGLAQGTYLFEGRMVNRVAGDTLGIPALSLSDLLGEGGERR